MNKIKTTVGKAIPYLLAIVALGFLLHMLYMMHETNKLMLITGELNRSLEHDQCFINDEINAEFVNITSDLSCHRIATKPFYDMDLVAKLLSDSLVLFIQSVKLKILDAVDSSKGTYNTNIKELSQMMLGSDRNIGTGLVYQLQNKIEIYEKRIMHLFGSGFFKRINSDTLKIIAGLISKQARIGANGSGTAWEEYDFRNSPEIVDRMVLSSIQVVVRKTELNFVKYAGQIATESIKQFVIAHPNMAPGL